MSDINPVVEGWLNIATEKLSPPDKARIALEISSHFEEARERHRAEGMDEAEGLVQAIQELGDPTSASRRFRRDYLTDNDITLLNIELRSSIPLVRGIGTTIGILIMSLPEFLPAGFRGEYYAAAALCLALSLLPSLYKVRGKPGVPVAAILLISISSDCALAGTAYAGARGGFAITLLIFSYLIFTWPRLRLLLKLRKVRDVWQEMPPLVKN